MRGRLDLRQGRASTRAARLITALLSPLALSCERGPAPTPPSITLPHEPPALLASGGPAAVVTPEELARRQAREGLSEPLRDLELLAVAYAAARRGSLDEAAALAREAASLGEGARFAAWQLVAEVGGCAQSTEALKALSTPPPPRPWGGERLALLERQVTARCEPEALSRLDERLMERHPALAARLGLSGPSGGTRSFEEELKRALSLERALLNEEAASALEALSARPDLSAEQRWSAEWELLRVRVERLRVSYEASARRLDALAKLSGAPSQQRWRQARLLAAKAWSKSGDARRARAAYEELVREWGFSPEASEARFLLAFELYERQEWRAATEAFAQLCRHKGEEGRARRLGPTEGSDATASAEWYHAWSLYQLSPHRAAPFLEAQVGEGALLSEEVRRAAYWAAEAQASRDPKRAEALRARLVDGSPHDWYSLLLRARSPERFPNLSPLRLSRELALEGKAPGDARVSRRAARVGRAEALGLNEVAAYERGLIESELREGLKGLGEVDSLRRLAWARGLGLVEVGLRVSLGLASGRRHEPPRVEEGLWWQLAYPWGFGEAVAGASSLEGVKESVLMSFIRKESAFAPRALSPAQALGLMQLLGKTAQGIVRWSPVEGAQEVPESSSQVPESSVEPSLLSALSPESLVESLYDPVINVRLGARYLRALGERYGGQLPLVALAYNAGPAALAGWLRRAEGEPGGGRLDVFVERVPFKEARGYVKRVVQGVCVYELLYGEQGVNECAAALPLELRLEVREGVGF
jgi:hypothetical protein